MPNKPKHTPPPWTVSDWNQHQGEIYIWAPGTPRIAELPLRYVSINEQKANAAHIVRCVNEREELLESLKGLYEHCSMIHRKWGEHSNQREADAAIARGRAAIAAAEKES